MHILMLSQFYAPTIGGEERHVQDLSTELARRGHQVAVATQWREGLPRFETVEGVRIYRVRSTVQRAGWLFSEPERRHYPPFPDPETALDLRQVIRKEQPQVIHAHNWMMYSLFPLRAWISAPVILTLHDYSLSCANRRLMTNGAPCQGPGLLKCLNCAMGHYGRIKGVGTVLAKAVMTPFESQSIDLFLAVSQAVADLNRLPERGLPYEIVPNFIPDDVQEQRDSSHPALARLPGSGYLLFVGDVSRDKGVHILLRAYAGLQDPPPLVLIGRNCLGSQPDLPSGVIFLGGMPHTAVMEAWQRSRIALVPSVWPEPFGIVALEAMACGRPVIASQIGGLAEVVVDQETGLLTPPGDVDALRQAIQRLLDHPETAERMGQAAQRRVALYKASTVVEKIEHIYQKLGYSPGRRKDGPSYSHSQ